MQVGLGDRQFIFVGGAHRSGTTATYNMLGSDPRVSIFSNTGVIEDEGQYLQSVVPDENQFGKVGSQALNPEIRLNEHSPLVDDARGRLFNQWRAHWNLDKPILAEKTPANLFRSRFLQAVFPNSHFLFIVRHPIAATLALEKWRNTERDIEQLMRNWVRAHEILLEDLPHLRSATVLLYERVLDDPGIVADRFRDASRIDLNLDERMFANANRDLYYERWKSGLYMTPGRRPYRIRKWLRRLRLREVERRYENEIRRFGYSFSAPVPLTNDFPCVR